MKSEKVNFNIIVPIPPNIENFQIRKYILDRVNEIEGTCLTNVGYVLINSAKVMAFGSGKIILKQFTGNWHFEVTVLASALSVKAGDVVKCSVSEITEDGILCESVWKDNGKSPAMALVLVQDELDNAYVVGDVLNILVSNTRFHTGDTCVVLLGSIKEGS